MRLCTIHICRKHRAEYAQATLKINAEISGELDYVPTGCGGGYLPYRGLRIERVDGLDQVYGYTEEFGVGCSGSGPVHYRSLAHAKVVADKYASERALKGDA